MTSWFDDMSDTELLDLIPLFERIATADSTYAVLHSSTRLPLQCCTGQQTVPIIPQHR